METNSALLAICAGNSPVPGEFPTQRPVTRSFDVFYDLRLNKRLSKQSWGWWFETLSRPLWRHRNVLFISCDVDTRVRLAVSSFWISFDNPSMWELFNLLYSGLSPLRFYICIILPPWLDHSDIIGDNIKGESSYFGNHWPCWCPSIECETRPIPYIIHTTQFDIFLVSECELCFTSI